MVEYPIADASEEEPTRGGESPGPEDHDIRLRLLEERQDLLDDGSLPKVGRHGVDARGARRLRGTPDEGLELPAVLGEDLEDRPALVGVDPGAGTTPTIASGADATLASSMAEARARSEGADPSMATATERNAGIPNASARPLMSASPPRGGAGLGMAAGPGPQAPRVGAVVADGGGGRLGRRGLARIVAH